MELILTKKQMDVLTIIQSKQANEILYGGAAGGGKSWLIRALAIIWSVQVPGAQVFIFRRKIKDLRATHLFGHASLPNMLKDYVKDGLCKINLSNNYVEFTNGSVISLHHCQHEADLQNHLSAEFHILLIDESTTFSEKMIRFLRSRVRIGSMKIPQQFKGCLPFILYGTNPRGESHGYFKSNFVDASEECKVFKAPKNDGSMRRVFIPSKLSDNPHIEDDYADKLRGLGDPDIVEAYLSGDWSVVEGMALPTLSRKHHIIDAAACSLSWKVYRAYDYGFSAPYFYICYMVATGESNTDWCPPKGSIIIHTEIYGADESNNGLREDVAVTASKMLVHESLHYPYTSVQAGPADNSIYDKEQGPSIYDNMREENPGVEFTDSDKSPGSRVLGVSEVRRLLYNTIHYRHERPGLYFSSLANKTYDQLSQLVLDDKKVEDVNTDQNDHSWDVVRYIVLRKSIAIKLVSVGGT